MRTDRNANTHVKVLFNFENARGETEIESVWARPVVQGYQLDNIPFYAREAAYNDIVAADPDEDGVLWYAGLIVASGHSTIRLWFENESDVAGVRDRLREMGCQSELDLPRLVAVDIPPSLPYEKVKEYFEQMECAGVLEYEEACLGQA